MDEYIERVFVLPSGKLNLEWGDFSSFAHGRSCIAVATMRIAVTGGAGFIGSHVVDHLVADGHDVVVIDLKPPHRHDVDHRAVDILDLRGLVRATRGCEAVFHLAGVADVNHATADPVLAAELNVAGTAKVWEASRRNGVSRAVLASTVWVYSAAAGSGPVAEDTDFDLLRPGHLYTSSKIAAELVARSYQELYGLDFTVLRYGIPYGPRMRDALVISKFVRAALAGETITVDGDGSQHRNYVYVEDLARAHVLALGPKAANETFNLEGTERVTVRQLVESIQRVVARPVAVQFGEARAGDYAGREVSAAKAARVLKWTPAVPFQEGLRRYVDWYIGDETVAWVAQDARAAHRERAPRSRRPTRRFALVASLIATVLTAASVSLVGATTANASWFGSVVSHAPRVGHRVAVTVEVPSLPSARPLQAALDAAGVKATFFTSGRSLVANPKMARSLVGAGHLLGTESYRARRTELFDPAYRGLGQAQDAFERTVGRCPTFFRPPHGNHTPFMARVAHHRRMTMVTWDVSMGASNITREALERRLQRVRPGSIVNIRVNAPGTAEGHVDALPALLRVLQARHLQSVRLDELLDLPAYAGRC